MIETWEQALEYFTKHNYDFLPGKDPNTFQPFPGAKVLDIGANLGMVTAFWAMNGANVTSYEADPTTFDIMIGLFERLRVDVRAVNAAVWTHAGQVTFKGVGHMDGGRACRNGRIEFGPDTIAVPCVTLTEALGDTIWDCVKIDIEGAEFAVLMHTNLQALKNIRYMNLELHEDKYMSGGYMTAEQVDMLREKLEPMFDIYSSVYSSGFWHIKNKELQ